MKTLFTLIIGLACVVSVSAQTVSVSMVTNYATQVLQVTNRVAVSVRPVAAPVTLDAAHVAGLFAALDAAGVRFTLPIYPTNLVRFSAYRAGGDYQLTAISTNNGVTVQQSVKLPAPVLGGIAATWNGPNSSVAIGTNNLTGFSGAQTNGVFTVNFNLKPTL